jgi:hypothetical protein
MLVEYVNDILHRGDSSCEKSDGMEATSGYIVELLETSQKIERTLANASFCAITGGVLDLEKHAFRSER